MLLVDDPEPDIRRTAEETIALITRDLLAGFLARPDVPHPMRDFFKARGVEPAAIAAPDVDAPLIDTDAATAAAEPAGEADEAAKQGTVQRLALMSIVDRMQLAMKGSREERAILIRDPNKLISVSVLSSPKLTDSEVESFAKMANVSEEILRIIGITRTWLKNYGVVSALAKNPKTPVAVSLNLVQRLNERELKLLALDRNIQEPVKVAVRKRIATGDSRR